ncbi:oligopeptide/dipeptide ABC transporter ATP-binding protein [Catenulispora sp. MAP12-49]|uniref:oligopeptide/dipeptide ABC transporter ATP-binding protein n=1 Tax=Catenulispora sp. MAP12-49 TaxID=3156302 RepID=UPI00351937E4
MSTCADVPLVEISDLTVRYPGPGRRTAVTAVDGVSFTVGRGRTVGVVGESGSGKSSIGAALFGLVPTAGGTIRFDGADITGADRAERRKLARSMQIVFQDPYGSMNPARTVGATLGEALRHNVGLDAARTRARLATALQEVGLPESALDRYPGQFSGGQRQRLAIARALAMEPSFVVCDEAVSALDLSVQAQVLNLLVRLRERHGLGYLFISHDLAIVRYLSDEIVVLYAGRVVESGPAHILGDNPGHPYTRTLLAAAPVPDPFAQAERRAGRQADRLPAIAPATVGCAFAGRCHLAVERCRTERPELRIRPSDVAVACHRYDDIAAGGADPLRINPSAPVPGPTARHPESQ